MTAEEWILAKCSKSGEAVDVVFSKKDLPPGVSIRLVERTFGRLKRAGRITGGIIVSDNAGCTMKLKCLS